jgi:hypothetical protein
MTLTGATMASAFSAQTHTSKTRPATREQLNFTLEVLQGTTEHPERGMPRGRLSIGSGSKCWLRLGGDGVPDIHSWLEVTPTEVELYVFEEHPRVQVNGRPVRFAVLRGGESLLIGEFEFLIRSQPVAAEQRRFGAPHIPIEQLARLEAGLERPLAELSAEELLDLMQAEVKTIEDDRLRRRTGWSNLMGAIRNVQAEDGFEERSKSPISIVSDRPAEPAELTDDLERLVEQVEALTRSLQSRSEQLQVRETGYGDAAASLLETQQKLAEQMGLLIEALDRKADEEPLRKASA